MTSLVCAKCGTAIHSDTARLNAGLCMKCARRRPPGADTRREGKAQKYLLVHGGEIVEGARESEYLANLISRIHGRGEGLDGLAVFERQYYLLYEVLLQLREGSIFCFFDNSTGDRYSDVVALLDQLRLDRIANGLREAKDVLFGSSPVPEDLRARRQTMPTNRQGEPRREIRKALSLIDKKTENAEQEIEEKMREVARAGQLY